MHIHIPPTFRSAAAVGEDAGREQAAVGRRQLRPGVRGGRFTAPAGRHLVEGQHSDEELQRFGTSTSRAAISVRIRVCWSVCACCMYVRPHVWLDWGVAECLSASECVYRVHDGNV